MVTDRSDGYFDVALAWSAALTLIVLTLLAIAPDAALAIAERFRGGWVHDWSPREVFTFAALAATLSFGAMVLLQLVPALRFMLVPAPIRAKRVHERALRAFRIGAEQRTVGATGILIYLSMREHRAEILADAAIASKVEGDAWADALQVLLIKVRQGDVAGGMCSAIERVGAILAVHVPKPAGNPNEIPDRLIEL